MTNRGWTKQRLKTNQLGNFVMPNETSFRAKNPHHVPKMAKNPPLVGHFPVCRRAGDRVLASGTNAVRLTPARQEAAFILRMSAPPQSRRSRLGLALRML